MGWDYSALQPSSSSDDLLKSLIIALLILRIIWSSPYWSLIKNLHGSEVGPGVRWGKEPPLRCQTQSLLCNSQCSINMQSICKYFAQLLLCTSQCAIREYVRSQCCPSMQSWALPWHPRHLTTALLHITMSATMACLLSTTPPVQLAICNQVQCRGTGGHVRGAAVWWQGNYNWLGAAWLGAAGA